MLITIVAKTTKFTDGLLGFSSSLGCDPICFYFFRRSNPFLWIHSFLIFHFTFFVGCVNHLNVKNDWNTPILESKKVILNPNHHSSSRIFDQCSRKAPPLNSDLWMPDNSQVTSLEKQLSKFSTEKNIKLASDFSDYYCQYVGFYGSASEKRIYGNFLLFSSKAIENLPDWRSVPLVACDGGRMFFGVIFDLDSEKIVELRFNGNVAY